MLPSNRLYASWLAAFRIYVGILWILHALPKFLNGDRFLPPNGFIVMMVTTAVNGAPAMMPGGMPRPPVGGFYHDFLAGVVLPNISLFAEMVRVGELLVGIALILGLLSRIGGLGGMFLTANYMLAQGTFFNPAGWSGADGAVFVMSALNFVLPTGRVWGFDALFSRPKPASGTTTAIAEKPEDAGGP